jgi:hypothetical protein
MDANLIVAFVGVGATVVAALTAALLRHDKEIPTMPTGIKAASPIPLQQQTGPRRARREQRPNGDSPHPSNADMGP